MKSAVGKKGGRENRREEWRWGETVIREGSTNLLWAKQIGRGSAQSNGMNRPALSAEKVSDLVARLQRHPQLGEHMAAVLDAAENRAGPLHTGDEAEDATVERLGPLGR